MNQSAMNMDRPNILLICVDHWAAAMMGCAGNHSVMTPTINQLALTGTRFTNAYSPSPTCIPARRSLMTGLNSRNHMDRDFTEDLYMPEGRPLLAQCFRDAGYQAYAVGKLHVFPQRSRIGFDEVILNEEGRHHLAGMSDDWELYLADHGFGGQEYSTGMSNNDYVCRPWHLPERCHPTNWTVEQMCRTIVRRDPTKPAFWYLSFVTPHPPLRPLQCYLDQYANVELDPVAQGDWELPNAIWERCCDCFGITRATQYEVDLARRAFYAMITHIDHQIRVVIGTLREQKLLENTSIVFTSDHGDMLGDHGLWAKGVLYDKSAKIPMIINTPKADTRVKMNTTDDRLVTIYDVMPTLLDLADIQIPDGLDGVSMLTDHSRDHLYGEHWSGRLATRMVRDSRYKLIYYAAGNMFQLFDLAEDPNECCDLSDVPEYNEIRLKLETKLIEQLYGKDSEWISDGKLIGCEDGPRQENTDRTLTSQRGWRFI